MTKFTKRLALGAAGCMVLGFVGLNVMAYRHAYAMMHFTNAGARTAQAEELSFAQKVKVLATGINVPRPACNADKSELDPQAVSLKIPCEDGPRLGAWFCPGTATNILAVMFHGYTGEKSSLLQPAKAFQELGCSVMLVDFRGSGDSSESYCTIGYKESLDVAAAFRFAKREFPHARTVLFGQSMGAASLLRAIDQCGIQPDAIIVEAVFDSMLHTVRNRFQLMHVPSFPSAELLVYWGGKQAGFDGFSLNPVAYAAKVQCPALVMHGQNDPRAKLEDGRAVFGALAGPKTFKEFPSAGHESYVSRHPLEWKTAVGEFLASVKPASADVR